MVVSVGDLKSWTAALLSHTYGSKDMNKIKLSLRLDYENKVISRDSAEEANQCVFAVFAAGLEEFEL